MRKVPCSWFLVLGCLVLAGCLSTETTKTYPPDIAAACQRALDEARECVTAHGGKVKDGRLAVVKVPGERKVNGMWVWNDRYLNREVGGYRDNAVVYVGCNPRTGGEVSYGVLLHEFGHWLTGNTHNPKYNDCFHWAE